ncbi:class I SAM-dependent RNA methyltransferase [Gephyromycinifex aptenodytis]|uniref:class I SAM-dependent RNA methyltransferase n=1 Tax=Gephyromycinifex aptenodytis TaxID=2716227 RepID=UPI001D02E329|nr:TRAM domain-containing protein [Gephyromycinifex aptenodytis]
MELELEVGPIAHGGHCVARAEDGQVVFVRHTLPGEQVLARVTKGSPGDRFVFADAIEIRTPSPDRVEPRCPVAHPGGCGGCDFQHVDIAAQRRLKAEVVREQLARLGGLDVPVQVRPVPGDQEGLRWRTRVEFAVARDGRAGLHPQRSKRVLPLQDCPIAHPDIIATGVLDQRWPRSRSVDVVAPSEGPAVAIAVPQGLPDSPTVRESVRGALWSGEFDINARGFWQVHPGAGATFVDHVLELLSPQPGERALDLYAGVGVFARALADQVGAEGAVLAIESDVRAVDSLLAAMAGRSELEARVGRVEHELAPLVEGGDDVDLVVLDPPRSGAGREVIEAICGMHPRAIAYVACDPAALGRDVAYARQAGYEVSSVQGFDAFPMTHHVETIAHFVPAEAGTSRIS